MYENLFVVDRSYYDKRDNINFIWYQKEWEKLRDVLLGREVRLKFRVNCLTLSCWFSSTLGPFSEGSVKLTFGREYFAATKPTSKILLDETWSAFWRNLWKEVASGTFPQDILVSDLLVEAFEGLLGDFREDLEDLEDLEDRRCYQ